MKTLFNLRLCLGFASFASLTAAVGCGGGDGNGRAGNPGQHSGPPSFKREPALAKPNTPLNWKTEFGAVSWQKSVREGCSEDFEILRNGTNTGAESCAGGANSEQTFRHLTEQEIKLNGFIKTVVERAAPTGYALGTDRDSRVVWVEDLNNDGKMDMAFFLASTANTGKSRQGYVPPTSSILMIVTPISLDGISEKLAELSFLGLDESATPGWRPTDIEDVVDFNHDGEKELIIPGYANKPNSVGLKIDFSKGTISLLETRMRTGEIGLADVVSVIGFGYMIEGFFSDVDEDGVDDYVRLERQFADTSNERIQSLTFSVFKWNGALFDYSKSLTDQLSRRDRAKLRFLRRAVNWEGATAPIHE